MTVFDKVVKSFATQSAMLALLTLPAAMAFYALNKLGFLPMTFDAWWAVWVLLAAVALSVRTVLSLEELEEILG